MPKTYDIAGWEEHFRRKGALFGTAAKACRMIEEAPGRTLSEKRAYWEGHAEGENPTLWQRVHFRALGGVVFLNQMILHEGHDAVSNRPKRTASKPTRECDPVAEATASGQRTAEIEKGRAAEIAVLVEAKRQATNNMDPSSEEYRLTCNVFDRRIREVMQR